MAFHDGFPAFKKQAGNLTPTSFQAHPFEPLEDRLVTPKELSKPVRGE
jgi:hypothetical protein